MNTDSDKGGWSDVQPSRTGGPYPDWLDWLEFQEDRAHELLRWRRDVIKSVDPNHKITMHWLGRSIELLPAPSANDWRAAAVAIRSSRSPSVRSRRRGQRLRPYTS